MISSSMKISELDPVEPVTPMTTTSSLPVDDSEIKFFESVEKDVNRILRKDKIQEEYKIVRFFYHQLESDQGLYSPTIHKNILCPISPDFSIFRTI